MFLPVPLRLQVTSLCRLAASVSPLEAVSPNRLVRPSRSGKRPFSAFSNRRTSVRLEPRRGRCRQGMRRDVDRHRRPRPGRLGSLEDGWRRLAALAGNPYLTPEWHAACSSRPGVEPVVVAVRSGDGALRGVLPLVRVSSGPVRWLRFPGDDLGDEYAMLVAPGDDPAEVARLAGRGLRAAGVRWDAFALYYVDAGAPWLSGLLEGLGEVATMRRGEAVRPYVDLSAGDWAGYLSALKRDDRKGWRRERRALEAGASYRLLEDPAEAEEGMAVLFRLHDMRWSDRGGRASRRRSPGGCCRVSPPPRPRGAGCGSGSSSSRASRRPPSSPGASATASATTRAASTRARPARRGSCSSRTRSRSPRRTGSGGRPGQGRERLQAPLRPGSPCRGAAGCGAAAPRAAAGRRRGPLGPPHAGLAPVAGGRDRLSRLLRRR